ncbi:MAG: 16S rRNA (cytosine(1402)-N(4))-methyltransferase RsmH [Bacteroidetes bacterium]|nr:16S rRNA (cytosine(1402)-N(4))-methyltransferase RsmH [Bacteroidota bacterium]
MLGETLGYLITESDGIYVDGTLGGGGHAEAICERLSGNGTLIGIDADADAIHEAGNRLRRFERSIHLVNDNTAHIAHILRARNISTIHGLLLDLGVSSFQLDEASKGFSFRGDDRLDMRMDRRQPLDAFGVVNGYDEAELADVIFHYGEERASRRIARRIVERRSEAPIETTGQLAAIVQSVAGGKFAVKSMARVFQAIRIEVNDELHRLQAILSDVLPFIAPGGRIVVISYHSLEDRIVKTFFNECAAEFIPSGNKFQPDTPRVPELKVLTKRPVEAADEEQRNNSRSRSAKLRAAERTAH